MIMTDEVLIESFHALWNNYPYMVRLIRKDRIVLAVNKASAAAGLETGVLCTKVGSKESHMGCLANLAMKEKLAKHQLAGAGARLKFWIPVEGRDDVFVHFTVPAAEYTSGNAGNLSDKN
jgi:hypothetical protein